MTVEGVIAIVFVLGLVLGFHETGHFLVAKACGMRVEEFGVGLPIPGRIWGIKLRETVYSLNWLPFGAFVKIAGMEPGEEDVPGGFHTRPIWQRTAVILAGCTMNVVLAALLLWAVGATYGEPTRVLNTIAIVQRDSPAEDAGLRPGDRILAINDRWHSTQIVTVAPDSPAGRVGLQPEDSVLQVGEREVGDLPDLLDALREANGKPVELVVWRPLVRVGVRNGQPVYERSRDLDLRPIQVELPAVAPGTLPAELAREPRRITVPALGLTFEPLDWAGTAAIIQRHPGETVTMVVARDGRRLTVPVVPRTVQDKVARANPDGTTDIETRRIGRIGISPLTDRRKLPPAESIVSGFRQTATIIIRVLQSVGDMITRRMPADVNGIIAAGHVLAQDAAISWYFVLRDGAYLSILVALFNLLPFPPLDGWRLVYLGFEKIIGRAPDRRKEWVINLIGFAAIILVAILLSYKDISEIVANWRLK